MENIKRFWILISGKYIHFTLASDRDFRYNDLIKRGINNIVKGELS